MRTGGSPVGRALVAQSQVDQQGDDEQARYDLAQRDHGCSSEAKDSGVRSLLYAGSML